MSEKIKFKPVRVFQEIIEHLLPLADSGKSPITNEMFQGFSKDEGDGLRCWLIKRSVS